LQHAIDQVRDWLLKVEDQRPAVLEELGLKANDVTKIRALVVAGRDGDWNPDHLRNLKRADFGERITVCTYDDLLACLESLANEMASFGVGM
jgi:hypothetical protein